MKKIEILKILDNYSDDQDIPEIERRVDLIHLRKSIHLLTHIVYALIFSITFFSFVWFLQVNQKRIIRDLKLEIDKIEKENYHNRLAIAITNYYWTQKNPVKFKDVKDIVVAVEKYTPISFTKGSPFETEDFLALAATESGFKPDAVSFAGARGVFQILDWRSALVEIKEMNGDPFDIETNLRMAIHILKQKYNTHKDWRESIIAYNGFFLDDKGKVIEKFWNDFLYNKNLIRKLKEDAKRI